MTDSTQNIFRDQPVVPHRQTIGVGAFLVAMLIVAALVLTAIKLANGPQEGLSSLIPFDQPALLSNFTA